jgi:two-component system, sensor histidine kinase RegB
MRRALDVSLPWFRRVRTTVWACQAALLVWAAWGLGIRLQSGWIAALIALGFGSDALAWAWQRRGVRENDVLALMLLDAALHTAVFALSGGPFNPFTMLYLVNVVLAALVLSSGRQWVVLGAQLVGFASLFLVERVVPSTWALPGHQELMRLHLAGMWIAFVVASAFIVYFVQRVLAAFARQQRDLTEARRLQTQHEKLAALTTLAAGAAHELATPLGTIAIASHDMVRALAALDVPASVKDDAVLVREQVERCRTILQSLSMRSGALVGERLTTFPASAWVDDALSGLPQRDRVVVTSMPAVQLTGPREALAQALRNLVKNALEASTAEVTVALTPDTSRSLTVDITDRGEGLGADELERIGEPFFTTKPVGRGMGLGVFLCRTLAQQLGGSVTYRSRRGEGTTATLALPGALA